MKISNSKNHSGNLKISRDSVEEIAAQAVGEIEGVFSLAPLPATLKSFFFDRVSDKPINVNFDQSRVCINVAVNMKNGHKIKNVTENIQKQVKSAVQSMSGIAVSKVNVYVAGVCS
ncbi:MAG: Asp23/Gls24 family envelope stress response protein [Oscillospiraceae bacterium]|nr:Asp23/Gls24 family envelope stress response protein [Oscillospiraceae bacterium]